MNHGKMKKMSTNIKIRNEPTDRYQIIDGWSNECDSIYSARAQHDAIVLANLAILRGYSAAAVVDIKERKIVETVNTSGQTNGHGSIMLWSELKAGYSAWAVLLEAEKLYAGVHAREEKVGNTRDIVRSILRGAN